MKLTPIEEVRKGYWFVRRVYKIEGEGKESWAIGLIYGEFPFLYGSVIAYPDEINGRDIDRIMRGRTQIDNPREWEFGPKIEFPDE